MAMSMSPCVVIASATNSIKTTDIIKDILSLNELPEPVGDLIVDGIVRYPWHITTKYYEADIELCSLETKTIGTRQFADSVDAIILCFDCHSNDGLDIAEQWLTFTKEFEPEIKMLLCDYCSNSDDDDTVQIKKLDAQKFCIENGFELIILNESVETTDSDLEDDFPESVGMCRVIQGLQAHIWPNLVMKDKAATMINVPVPESTAQGSSDNKDLSSNKTESESESKENVSGTNSRQERIDSLLEDNEASTNEEMFDKLFQNLKDFKLKADKMSFEDRKTYAEKMTIQFWKSMGGNESEIDDLSDPES